MQSSTFLASCLTRSPWLITAGNPINVASTDRLYARLYGYSLGVFPMADAFISAKCIAPVTSLRMGKPTSNSCLSRRVLSCFFRFGQYDRMERGLRLLPNVFKRLFGIPETLQRLVGAQTRMLVCPMPRISPCLTPLLIHFKADARPARS